MGQRLGIAAALLGDPHTLILDEPVNGLDPEGVKWIRTMVRQLAGEGRTVFISSHLMSEMSLTADQLLVIGRGTIAAGPSATSSEPRHATRSEWYSPRRWTGRVGRREGATVTRGPDGELRVSDMTSAQIEDLAAAHGLPLHELTPLSASLEDAYLSLTVTRSITGPRP